MSGEERRKAKRLELDCKLILKAMNGSDESTDVEVTDCSKSGIGFNSHSHLTLGENYDAYLTIWTKETMHVFIQITRGIQTSTGYNYGGIFIGMAESDLQRISVYETVEELTHSN